MGHLVNPTSFRLGFSRYRNSRWSVSSSMYKYHSLIKSDWNIFVFLTRLFKRKAMINSSFVFSHCNVIRTSFKTYVFVYLWDGKMIFTISENFSQFFMILSKYRFLNKFVFSLKFFLAKYFVFFSLKKFFILKNDFLFTYYITKKKINFYFNYFFKKEKLCFREKKLMLVFLFNFKFEIFFHFKSIKFPLLLKIYHIFFLRKLQTHFTKIKYNFSMIKYFTSVPLNSIIRNQNEEFLSLFIIKNFISKFTSNFFPKHLFEIILKPISKLDITSAFVGRYLAIRMQQRYRLMQALRPLFRDLKKNPIVEGYRIACSGRFTKKEIASYKWFRFGSVPTGSVSKNIDFIYIPFILKYSLCCFKIWLNINPKKVFPINREFFLFSNYFSHRNLLKLKTDFRNFFSSTLKRKKKKKTKFLFIKFLQAGKIFEKKFFLKIIFFQIFFRKIFFKSKFFSLNKLRKFFSEISVSKKRLREKINDKKKKFFVKLEKNLLEKIINFFIKKNRNKFFLINRLNSESKFFYHKYLFLFRKNSTINKIRMKFFFKMILRKKNLNRKRNRERKYKKLKQ